MANKVNEIIEDINHRIGNQTGYDPRAETVLRTMNRLYTELNSDLECLEKEYEIEAGDLSDTVYYITKPADLLKIYKITDEADDGKISGFSFVDSADFEVNDTRLTYTIEKGLIKFSGVSASTNLILHYKSSGLELVNEEDADISDSTTQTNTPEWDARHHAVLFYGCCIELKQDYPQYQTDVFKYEQAHRLLKESTWNNDGTTPDILGGTQRYYNTDDYGMR